MKFSFGIASNKKSPVMSQGADLIWKFKHYSCDLEINLSDFEQVVEIFRTSTLVITADHFTFGAWFTGFPIKRPIIKARSGMCIRSRMIFWLWLPRIAFPLSTSYCPVLYHSKDRY